MERLFTAVRERCPAEAWSLGVSLARSGSVSIESSDEDEVIARVKVQGAALTPTVELYLQEDEWECDCLSLLDACEHVAAAVVALRQGKKAPAEARPMTYRFRRTPRGLAFERGIVDDGSFCPIESPLEAVASGRFSGPPFTATRDDLAVEKALGGRLTGVLDREAVPPILEALSRLKNVELDGLPIETSPREVLPSVRVEDAGDGFRLSLHESGEIDEVFGNGVALCGRVLRPMGEPALSGRELSELARGRVYGPVEIGELVSEVLPSLGKRVPVDIRSANLPRAAKEQPTVSLLFERQGERLYVLPSIVYGDPPCGRVEGDRLIALGGAVPYRLLDAERQLTESLVRELGLTVGRGEELATEEAIEMVQKLEGWNGRIEGRGHEYFRLAPRLGPRTTIHAKGFDLNFETSEKPPRSARAESVFRAYREGRSLVPLEGGGFSPLPLDWLDRYGERLADLMAARDAGEGALPKAALPELAGLCEDLDEPPPPELEKIRAWVGGFTGISEAPLPETLAARLRDYQRQGVNWLVFLREAGLGALLADDMGLGKTLQALCALEGRTLVAAPTSVLHNWKTEAARFRPELTVCLYHGGNRTLEPDAALTITSHALLRQDKERLSAVAWDTVVIDEAQAIKNPDSQLAQAVYGLPGKFRMSLTGTPIENRLEDLWSQFHFLNRGFLGGLTDFKERYIRPIESGEERVLERLRKRIGPFFLRRLKGEVAPELPPRTEMTLRCELGPSERELYEAIRLAVRNDVLAKLEAGGNPLTALEALLRLRQAACHPALVPGQEASSSSKTEVLLSSLETTAAEGHRALVFSQWTTMLDLLEPHLKRERIDFLRLDGTTRDRVGVVSRFQQRDGPPVFLISLKAGGTGLNLTAADHVFILDPWWNPAVEDQAADRAHRIGQKKPVFVHRLIAADTVEERVLALQQEKQRLSDLTTAATGGVLSREDLLHLLE